MSSGRGVSEDPTHYKSFVVYLKHGSAPCQRLRELCLPHQDVVLQDVAQLKGEKPGWLLGVPTVVELPNYKLHKGTAALRFVEERLRSRVQGVGVGAGAAAAAAAPADVVLEPQPAAAASTAYSALEATEPSFAPLTADARYDDAPPGKVDHAALEAAMRRRHRAAPPQPL